jgi:pyruvate ferredoxin oxidoreductase delta subunit
MKPQLTKDWQYPKNDQEMVFGSGAPTGQLTAPNSGWRVFRPVIDQEKCVKCLLCWTLCPDGVIDKTEGWLTVDYDFCKGCGICAHECPRKAITMTKEAK